VETAIEANTPQEVEEEEVDVAARLEEIFRGFEAQGAPGAGAPLSCRIELEGEGGGSHLLHIAPEGVSWEADTQAPGADIGVRLSVEDFLAIADGKFDGRLAVASERIELSGNRELAENVLSWFEPPED